MKTKRKRKEKHKQNYIYKLPIDRPAAVTGIINSKKGIVGEVEIDDRAKNGGVGRVRPGGRGLA